MYAMIVTAGHPNLERVAIAAALLRDRWHQRRRTKEK